MDAHEPMNLACLALCLALLLGSSGALAARDTNVLTAHGRRLARAASAPTCQTQLRTCNTKLTTTTNTQKSCATSLSTTQTRLVSCNNKLSTANTDLTKCSGTLGGIRKRTTTLAAADDTENFPERIATLEAMVQELEVMVTMLKDTNAGLQEVIDMMSDGLTPEEECQTQLDICNANLLNSDSWVSTFNSSWTTCREDYKVESTGRIKCEYELARAQNPDEQLKLDLQSCLADKATLETDIATFDSTLGECERVQKEYQTAYTDSRTKVSALQASVADWSNKAITCQATSQQLTVSLNDATKQAAAVQASYEKCIADMARG